MVYDMLNSVKIVDLSRLLPGPLCTQILADLGAQVIKIEPVGMGEYTRWLPPYHRYESMAFLHLNRNKKSLALDLRCEEGKEIFWKLVKQADVVVESFRPGVLEKEGLHYEAACTHNPEIIYCSITGFGQSGPFKQRAAHDLNYLALSGLLDKFIRHHSQPVVPPVLLADIGGGALPGVVSILAALFKKLNGGGGDHLDVAMFDGLFLWSFLHNGMQQTTTSSDYSEDLLDGSRPCYTLYHTSDNRWLSVAAIEPKFWLLFVQGIGRPDLLDKQMVEGSDADEVRHEIQQIIGEHSLSHWQEVFKDGSCCVEPVLTLDETRALPHLKAHHIFTTVHHPSEGDISETSFPLQTKNHERKDDHPSPLLGAHTREILLSLGYLEADIQHLHRKGIVSILQ